MGGSGSSGGGVPCSQSARILEALFPEEECGGFGDNGQVDLTKGLGRDIADLAYYVTSPGVIYRNLLILGSTTGEGPRPAAPGHVRAFDVITGKQIWIFHTIPHPGEFGYETWPSDAYERTGGTNVWGGLSLDPKRGLVFLATGSPTFDFYGGDRLGNNLFGNCLIALEVATGKRVWHFQVVHHDVWDYDLPTAPSLVTVKRNGCTIDAVAQVSKMGLVFVFDRATGKPLFPIEETAVPASDVPGEVLSKTQHFRRMRVAAQGELYLIVPVDMLQPEAAVVLQLAMNREVNLFQDAHFLSRKRHQEHGLC